MGFDLTPPNTTRSLIFKAYEAARSSYEPVGINVGDLGHECDRALWYNLRRVSPPEVIEGRKLRIFDTGDIEEKRILDDLRSIGCYISEEQERVKFVGGHVRGKIDAEARGVPEAPKTVHLVECKSSNDKGFKELLTKGLQKGKPMHYAQCQMYMHGRGLTRCLYVCVNKNDDDIFERRVEYDATFCLQLLAKAERIIKADDPPSRVSENPRVPPCIWCKHKAVCHGGELALKNCRTCLHSTPITTSRDACWDCAKWQKPLTLDEQAAGCPSHLFIPSLVPGEQVDSDPEAETVTYRLANGETWVNSAQ
jgi:hypothetical protein